MLIVGYGNPRAGVRPAPKWPEPEVFFLCPASRSFCLPILSQVGITGCMKQRLFEKSEGGEGIPPWPVKAYKNLSFLNSDAARAIRVHCELAEPEERFRRHGINNTVVMFGSARIPPLSRLEKLRAEVAAADGNAPETAKLRGELAFAEKTAPYYEATRQLAAEITRWSMTIADESQRFHISSGGGPGIMEAANRGAREAGGKSIGLGISLPFEQTNNPYVSDELNFEFHYFFVRKFWLFSLAKALIVFPGGFGTLDELFEVLTLIQTRKSVRHVPVLLYGGDFWRRLINFDLLVEWGTICPSDLKLFRIVDSVAEARDFLVEELTRHYLTDPI